MMRGLGGGAIQRVERPQKVDAKDAFEKGSMEGLWEGEGTRETRECSFTFEPKWPGEDWGQKATERRLSQSTV